MRLLLLIITLSIYSTCAFSEPVVPKHIINKMTITWIPYTNQQDLTRDCVAMGAWVQPGNTVGACAIYDIFKRTCTIWVLEPLEVGDYRIGNLGHEVLHCFRGSFHKK